MSLTLDLPTDFEEKVKERAAETGQGVDGYFMTLVRRDLARPSLKEAMAPLQKSFAQSGMSEEEWLALFEEERRAMREERRDAAS